MASGETIEGDIFQVAIGGKGVNQAVAASRMGARVAFIGRVGNDDRGNHIIERPGRRRYLLHGMHRSR